MRCKRCGKDIKNLPEYIEDTGAEVLCSECAGTAERTDDIIFAHVGFRSMTAVSENSDELDVAA